MKQIIYFILVSLLIRFKYHSFWSFAEVACKRGGRLESMRLAYLEAQCSYIGRETSFSSPPKMPHGFHGVHISSGASIGKNVIIFQNVTIGSNTLQDSSRQGAPSIGDNVFIGAGAAIIGNVKIGNNCRIGANCVVVKDMPPNTVAVIGDIRFINKGNIKNEFINWYKFLESKN